MSKYDYWVVITEVTPPLNGNFFVAKARVHEIGVGEVDSRLGEVWGKTREEADQKMCKKIKEWLLQNEK